MSLENHLKHLSQNTIALRYRAIHEHVLLALDTLETQKISEAFKDWQIREKCLSVMKLALQSNNPILCNIGLQGIEHIVLHPDLDGIAENELDAMDTRIFVLQVLDSLNTLPSLSSEQQVFGLKILLGLCCDFISSFDGELIIKIVQMCLACWSEGNISILSSMVQLCAAFTMHKLCSTACAYDNVESGVHCAAESLASQAVERLANADIKSNENKGTLADVIGLAKFFAQQTKHASSNSQRAVHLECLLAVLKTLKSSHVRDSEMFFSYVSRDLCPVLATVISLNAMGAKVRLLDSKDKLKRKKAKNVSVTRSSLLHKKVALLSVELIRLVGCVASLRPHIALIFTHLLSPSTCLKHGIPFVAMNKLWATPEILFDLAGPFLVQDIDAQQNCTGILQLINDAMLSLCASQAEGSMTCNIDNTQLAIDSINSLLNTLDKARRGKGLRAEQVARYVEHGHRSGCCDDELPDKDELSSSESESNEEKIALETNKEYEQPNEVSQEDAKKVNLSSYISEDEDDVWVSSEDIYSSVSSPCYQSAAEDEDQFSDVLQKKSSSMFGLMKYIPSPSRSVDHSTKSDENSPNSTFTASDHTQEVDSDEDISKYIEEIVLPNQESTISINDFPESTKNSILARRHFSSIRSVLSELVQCKDVASIDQNLQKAASSFCSEIYENWRMEKMSVQADSLYALSYSVLLLSLRLKLCGHYDGTGSRLPCVKSQWVSYQQSTGIYLSKSWLSETFRQIIITDLFENIPCSKEQNNIPRLIEVLSEIDGLDHKAVLDNEGTEGSSDSTLFVKAGCEFSRQIAISVWYDLLQTLQYPLVNILDDKDDLSTSLFLILSPSSLRVRNEKERDCIISSLDALRTTFKLCCDLSLYDYSNTVLSRMVEACVPKSYSCSYNPRKEPPDINEECNLRLHISHVLCMDCALNVALQVGSSSSKCWETIFRVVSYISYLDRMFFFDDSPNFHNYGKEFKTSDLQNVTIAELIKENKIDVTWNGISTGIAQSTSMGFLASGQSAKAIYALSRNIDRIFEQAASSLDLENLTQFVWSLCLASHHQLFSKHSDLENVAWGTPLLYRLGECILKCARLPTRPLLHLSRVWHYASPHFAKVLGHSNTHLAKQAATYIYDVTATVLSYSRESESLHPLALWSDEEPTYFHFNEGLLQPYERTMQAEGCVLEIQDLIIASISQLVETSSKQICSGWRPLFSALKHVTYDQQTIERSPVLEVLNAFFVASNEPRVFANAAHDCIKCLFNMLCSLQDDASKTICQPTFIIRYLEETSNTLAQIYNNQCEEKFTRFNQIDVIPSTSGEGALWSKLTSRRWMKKEKTINDIADELAILTEKCFSTTAVSEDRCDPTPPVGFSDETGLLHTWFALMDGLLTRAMTTSNSVQPAVLDLLCKLLESSENTAGSTFSCHVLLHSWLPTLYIWLEKLDSTPSSTQLSSSLASYKHIYGTIMEVSAAAITKDLQGSHSKDEDIQYTALIDFIWVSYLNLCIASIQTRKEPLAKLGCSCFRHAISSIGRHMTSSMKDDVCDCLKYLIDDGLAQLVALTSLYEQNINTLDEMIVEVKETNSWFCDSSCLLRVFQSSLFYRPHINIPHQEVYISSMASSNKPQTRILLCELACDISSVSLLLKCVEFLLFGDSKSPWQHVAKEPSANGKGCPSETASLHSTSLNDVNTPRQATRHDQALLNQISATQVYELCVGVAKCFVASRNFDSHHDLQRLVQKLGKFYNAANLYQFAGSCYDLYLRIVLAVYCQFVNPSQQSMSASDCPSLHHVAARHRISISDLVAKDETTRESLKPDTDKNSSTSWAFHSLHKSMILLSHPWTSNDPCFTFSTESDTFLPCEDDRVSSDLGETMSPKEGDDVIQPIDINPDYMAYVKKTDLPKGNNGKSHLNSEKAKPQQLDRRSSPGARDKVFGRLISAYKKRKNQNSYVSKMSLERESAECDTDSHSSSSHLKTSRTRSGSSSTYSAVVGMDDRILEQQVWSSSVESALRLLTSAPDHVLSGLLPVVYKPLTGLANYRPLSSVLLEENDVGDAFRKWLLRVGDFWSSSLCNGTNN